MEIPPWERARYRERAREREWLPFRISGSGTYYVLRHAGIVEGKNTIRIVEPDPCIQLPEAEPF